MIKSIFYFLIGIFLSLPLMAQNSAPEKPEVLSVKLHYDGVIMEEDDVINPTFEFLVFAKGADRLQLGIGEYDYYGIPSTYPSLNPSEFGVTRIEKSDSFYIRSVDEIFWYGSYFLIYAGNDHGASVSDTIKVCDNVTDNALRDMWYMWRDKVLSVKGVQAEDGLSLLIAEGQLHAELGSGRVESIVLYRLSGEQVAAAVGAALNVGHLAKGVYLVSTVDDRRKTRIKKIVL
jgi:hypothetical protein